METKEYRKKEFEKISTVYNEYNTKVKFIKPNGATNFIDINNSELHKIINLLTDYNVIINNGEFQLTKKGK